MEIKLKNIFNARDLGGMQGADGRLIKPKRLIRSSCLYNASKKDAKILTEKYNLKNVVDFRSIPERDEKAHPKKLFSNVNYYSLPSFDTIVNAFTRDKESLKFIQKHTTEFSEDEAIEFIEIFYR